jgi:hypothetical protein
VGAQQREMRGLELPRTSSIERQTRRRDVLAEKDVEVEALQAAFDKSEQRSQEFDFFKC